MLDTKKKTPIIHEIKVEQYSGELQIESDNVSQITVKYYLIDAEILFSRSPFVQDQAEQFSYVKPFTKLIKDTEVGKITHIPLPDELKGKNVVIEINSDGI